MKKLLLDEMLGRTVKWLRIFGVDVEYSKGREDEELLEAAKTGLRTLVTKDEPLAAKCRKQGITCLLVKSMTLEEQIAEIKTELKLQFTFPDETRCPSCNHELKLVSGSEVSGLVHENVLKLHDKFWKCDNCKKAYWEGSHWPNITRIFETVQKLAKEKNKKQ